MLPQLSEELRRVIASGAGQPVQVEDPVTHARYVLVELQVYEQLQRARQNVAEALDPRDYYPAFAAAVQDDLDAPGMNLYESEINPQNKP